MAGCQPELICILFYLISVGFLFTFTHFSSTLKGYILNRDCAVFNVVLDLH